MVAGLMRPRISEVGSVHRGIHVVFVTNAAELTTLRVNDHSHLDDVVVKVLLLLFTCGGEVRTGAVSVDLYITSTKKDKI